MRANTQRSPLLLSRPHGASALSSRLAPRAHASSTLIDLCISSDIQGAQAGIVGSFNSWDVSKALPLVKHVDKTRAEAQLTLPKGSSFEFKLVLLDESDVKWEQGENRRISLPAPSSPLSKLHIECTWGDTDEMIVESDMVPCVIVVPSLSAHDMTANHSLTLVGSARSLGQWKPDSGLKLTRQGDTWTGQACLPAGLATEAKLLLVDEADNVQGVWEFEEDNRVIQPLSSSIIILHWGVMSETKIMPLDSPLEAMAAVSVVATEFANASEHRASMNASSKASKPSDASKPLGDSMTDPDQSFVVTYEFQMAARVQAVEEEKRSMAAQLLESQVKQQEERTKHRIELEALKEELSIATSAAVSTQDEFTTFQSTMNKFQAESAEKLMELAMEVAKTRATLKSTCEERNQERGQHGAEMAARVKAFEGEKQSLEARLIDSQVKLQTEVLSLSEKHRTELQALEKELTVIASVSISTQKELDESHLSVSKLQSEADKKQMELDETLALLRSTCKDKDRERDQHAAEMMAKVKAFEEEKQSVEAQLIESRATQQKDLMSLSEKHRAELQSLKEELSLTVSVSSATQEELRESQLSLTKLQSGAVKKQMELETTLAKLRSTCEESDRARDQQEAEMLARVKAFEGERQSLEAQLIESRAAQEEEIKSISKKHLQELEALTDEMMSTATAAVSTQDEFTTFQSTINELQAESAEKLMELAMEVAKTRATLWSTCEDRDRERDQHEAEMMAKVKAFDGEKLSFEAQLIESQARQQEEARSLSEKHRTELLALEEKLSVTASLSKSTQEELGNLQLSMSNLQSEADKKQLELDETLILLRSTCEDRDRERDQHAAEMMARVKAFEDEKLSFEAQLIESQARQQEEARSLSEKHRTELHALEEKLSVTASLSKSTQEELGNLQLSMSNLQSEADKKQLELDETLILLRSTCEDRDREGDQHAAEMMARVKAFEEEKQSFEAQMIASKARHHEEVMSLSEKHRTELESLEEELSVTVAAALSTKEEFISFQTTMNMLQSEGSEKLMELAMELAKARAALKSTSNGKDRDQARDHQDFEMMVRVKAFEATSLTSHS